MTKNGGVSVCGNVDYEKKSVIWCPCKFVFSYFFNLYPLPILFCSFGSTGEVAVFLCVWFQMYSDS